MMKKLLLRLCIGLVALSGGIVHADGADGRPTVGIWYSNWYAKNPPVASTWASGFGIGSTNQLLGDVNGDGKDDAVVYVDSTGTWYVETSNGNGLNYYSTWATGHGTSSTSQFLADVNGDGKADAIAFTAGSVGKWSVALSNGTTFGTPSDWITGHGIGSTKQFVEDVNGDGKADAIVFFGSAGSWYVSLSTGSAFNVYSMWITGHGVGSTNQLMGDVNADGKADAIVFFNAAGSWYSSLSTGSAFQAYTQWASGFATGSQNQFAKDANGDGYADMFAYYNSDRSGDGNSGDWYGKTYSRDFPGNWNGETLMNSGVSGATKTFQANVTGDSYGWKASVAFTESTGTWKVEPYHNTKLNEHDSWTAWDVKYVPYVLGTYQTYDSNNTAVIDDQLQSFADAKIDFLLFDATNGLYADDAYIYERQETAASRINTWNGNPSNRKVKYALAVGVVQFTHTPQSVEFEAGEVWNKFVNSANGGTDNFYYENGKPLLVLYCASTDRVAWQNWTGDKTNSNKFTVRFAEGPASQGFYGWFTPASGAIVDNHAMNVMPGVNNHYPGFTPISRENGDYYSKKSWDRVMTKNPRPEVVIISSYNEYREDNLIAPTSTANVTGTTEKWYNKSGVIDDFMYWNMTKEYIRRLENRALGVSRSASSTGESTDWGLSRINDGQLNSVTGSFGYTSQNSLTTNHAEYVTLDLGASKSISRVDLYPRNDTGNVGYGFPVDFTIQVSMDNVNWTMVITRTGYALPSNAVQTFTFTAASARYIKVNATSLRPNPSESNNYRLQLNEIEIY